MNPFRNWLGKRRLQRLVEAQAKSPEVIGFRIRRAAGKLGHAGRVANGGRGW